MSETAQSFDRGASVSEGAPVIHATTVALWRPGGWRGVLIQGASGVGKSDLALRAIAAGWRLVADDRTLVWRSGGRVFGRAPRTLLGLIEARGLDVVATDPLAWVRLDLVVECVDASQPLPRIAEPDMALVLQSPLSRVQLSPREASAPAKLTLALLEAGRRFDRTEPARYKRPRSADELASRSEALREEE